MADKPVPPPPPTSVAFVRGTPPPGARPAPTVTTSTGMYNDPPPELFFAGKSAGPAASNGTGTKDPRWERCTDLG